MVCGKFQISIPKFKKSLFHPSKNAAEIGNKETLHSKRVINKHSNVESNFSQFGKQRETNFSKDCMFTNYDGKVREGKIRQSVNQERSSSSVCCEEKGKIGQSVNQEISSGSVCCGKKEILGNVMFSNSQNTINESSSNAVTVNCAQADGNLTNIKMEHENDQIITLLTE